MKKLFLFALLGLFVATQMNAQNLERRVLIEEFTSSTCAPCASLNTYLNPWLASVKDQTVVVKYQMNYPSSGDPYYIADCGTRQSYYGNISGVPTPFVAGEKADADNIQTYQQWMAYITSLYTEAAALPSKADITGTFQVQGNMISVETTITPTITEEGYSVYVTVCEKVTYDNKRTNGETEFHHVLMKMLPNASGTAVNLVAGTPIPLSFTYDMSTTNVEEMDDLEVSVFIQKKTTPTASPNPVIHAVYLEDISSPAPENVEAANEEETLNITITWEAPSEKLNVEGYNIYRDGIKLNDSPLSATTFSYSDVAPEYGITYKYGVAAIIDGGEGYYGYDEVMAIVNVPEPINIEAEQTLLNTKEMLITWEVPDIDFPISGYNVYRNNIKVNTSLITENSFTNTGLSFREYCFTVEAIVNELKSEKSEEGCVTLIEIAAPKKLKAEQTAIGELTINLAWEAVTSIDVDGYNIYRNGAKINDELVVETAYQDETPEFDVKYDYTVVAVYAEIEGTFSTKASVTPLEFIPAVTGISATQVKIGELEISLKWNAFYMPHQGVYIYRDGEKINTEPISASPYVDLVSKFDVEYCYTFSYVVDDVEGQQSEEACVTAAEEVGIYQPALEAAINIYPNPVTSTLYLDTELNITEYQIFDIQGRLIHSSKTGAKEVATGEWSAGIYIIKIITDNGAVNKRFVKQ